MKFKSELLVCSNVVLNPIDKIILEKNKSFKIIMGDFDNIWINATNSNFKNIFIHCDILNISPEIRFNLHDISYCNKVDRFLINQLKQLKKISIKKNLRVVFTTMTNTIISSGECFEGINKIVNNFNKFIVENFDTINLDYIISQIGFVDSFKSTNFYRFTAPYSLKFLNLLGKSVVSAFDNNKYIKKKVLILDCDNTIWKGVLGEDGEDNIEFKDTAVGNCFFEVQKNVESLVKQGSLLCLCTKNNYDDVAKLLKKNLMPINFKNTSIIKSNWNNKSKNIKEISKELNLGLDSFVFIDDSSFELSEVKNNLPMVQVFKVPENTFDYPGFFRKNILKLFKNTSLTKEDKDRVSYYQNELKRKKHSSKFRNNDEFIDSLKLKLKIFSNGHNKKYINRISQMTQKTNQFNLTTKRYTEEDIKKILNDKNYKVFTGDVSDHFGDHGKTILMIMKISKNSYEIDTFLMSCRVIGRQLEKVFFDSIYKKIKLKKKPIIGKFHKTQKNEQVQNIYKDFGFQIIENRNTSKTYILDTSKKYKFSKRKIKVVNGK